MAKNTELIESIRMRCVECGDCWLWQGAMSDSRSSKRPVMQHENKVQSVRRVVAGAVGKKIVGNLRASNICADSRCVAPDHVKIMDQKQIQTRASEITKHQSNPARIKKMQQSLPQKILNWEMVHEIRASDKTHRQLAAEYGVTPCTIWGVKTHRSWREYQANPFSGLMTNYRKG